MNIHVKTRAAYDDLVNLKLLWCNMLAGSLAGGCVARADTSCAHSLPRQYTSDAQSYASMLCYRQATCAKRGDSLLPTGLLHSR